MFFVGKLFRRKNKRNNQWFYDNVLKLVPISFPKDMSLIDIIQLSMIAHDKGIKSLAESGVTTVKSTIKKEIRHVEVLNILNSLKKDSNEVVSMIRDYIIDDCGINKIACMDVCDSLTPDRLMLELIKRQTVISHTILNYLSGRGSSIKESLPQLYDKQILYDNFISVCTAKIENFRSLLTHIQSYDSYAHTFQFLDDKLNPNCNIVSCLLDGDRDLDSFDFEKAYEAKREELKEKFTVFQIKENIKDATSKLFFNEPNPILIIGNLSYSAIVRQGLSSDTIELYVSNKLVMILQLDDGIKVEEEAIVELLFNTPSQASTDLQPVDNDTAIPQAYNHSVCHL